MSQELTRKVWVTRTDWCTGTLLNRIIAAQGEGMGDVGSARYDSISKWIFRKFSALRVDPMLILLHLFTQVCRKDFSSLIKTNTTACFSTIYIPYTHSGEEGGSGNICGLVTVTETVVMSKAESLWKRSVNKCRSVYVIWHYLLNCECLKVFVDTLPLVWFQNMFELNLYWFYDFSIFLKLFGEKLTLSPSKVDLLHYWQTLCENGFDPSATYCQTMEKVLGKIIDSDTQATWQTTNGEADENTVWENQRHLRYKT